MYRLDVRRLLEITAAHGDSTGYAISRRTGISESSMYRFLGDAAQPDLNSAMRLSETYDVDLRCLMTRIAIEAAA